jgi:chromosome segregation ATPase
MEDAKKELPILLGTLKDIEARAKKLIEPTKYVYQLGNDLEELEGAMIAEVVRLYGKINHFENEITNLKNSLNNLSKELRSLKERVDSMEKEIFNMNINIALLATRITKH